MTFRGAFAGAGALVGAALVLGANSPPPAAPDTLGARLDARNARPRSPAEKYTQTQILDELQAREKRQALADRAGLDLGLEGDVEAADVRAWIRSNAERQQYLDIKISKLDRSVAALESKQQKWSADVLVDKERGGAGGPTAGKTSGWTQKDLERLLADQQALAEAQSLLNEETQRASRANELLPLLQAAEKELQRSALRPVSAEDLQATAVKRAVEKAIDGAVYSDEPRAIYWVDKGDAVKPEAVYNSSGNGGLKPLPPDYGVPTGAPYLPGVCSGQPSCGVAAQISSDHLFSISKAYSVLVLGVYDAQDANSEVEFAPAHRVTASPVMGIPPHNYCSPNVLEGFAKQPAPATCSASLIDDQVLLTAAHCIDTAVNAKDLNEAALLDSTFVFGFFRLATPTSIGQTEAVSLIPEGDIVLETGGYRFKPDQLYQAQGVVVDWGLDVAAIYLDRPVAAAYPRLRVGQGPAEGAQIHIVGTPLGLPLAHAWTTAHWADADQRQLAVRVDAFAGNSGSPLLDEGWGQIVAMLQSGMPDAPKEASVACRPLFTYQNDKEAHENALLASEILSWAHTVPMAELARDQREAWRRAAGR